MKRRRWFEVHSWIGIVTGLVMFLICWSGTVAVFSYEIDRWLDPRYQARSDAPAAGWQAWHDAVRAEVPDATSITLHAPTTDGAAAIAIVDTPAQAMQRVFLDPATAQVLGRSSYFNTQRFFRSLHMSLFDFGSGAGYGYWFVGVFGVLLLVASIAPLVFYRRWWRGFFKLERGRGWRIFWSDAHKLVGVWSLAFSLLMGITGTWYLVEWLDPDLGYPQAQEIARPVPRASISLDAAARQALEAWPALRITSMTPHEGSYWGNVIRIEGQAEAWLVRNRANFAELDPATGALLARQRAVDLGWPARWIDTADPLHFGDFAGLPVKTLWFVLGLGLSTLSLTGAYLHAQRLRASEGRARWRGTGPALLASLAVLAGTFWAGAAEIKGYGPAPHWPEVPAAIVAFLVVWVGLTLALLAAWAYLVGRRAKAGASRAVRTRRSG